MKVFVLGGTGAIGRPAVVALGEAGHVVTAVVRSAAKAEQVRAAGATPVEVSMFDRAELARAMAGHDAVVNLASAMPPTWQFVRLRAWRPTERVRREGSAAVVDAALAAGVPRLVQESVVMLYADQGSAWVDETAPVDRYPMGAGNHAAEASAARFTAAGRTGVVLRFGLFYGPGARHSEQFLALARRHVTPMVGRPDGYLSSIHVDDGGRAAAAALDAPAGTYNVVDDEPLTKRAYADALARAVGRTSWIRGPGRSAELLGHRLTSLTRSVRASNRLFRTTTGWRPAHPDAAAGYRAMAAGGRTPGSGHWIWARRPGSSAQNGMGKGDDVVGELVGEIDGVLARWRRRLHDRPDVERRRLLLLALEREQVVTVAYGEEVMAARLARLDLAPELRRLLHQPLVWAWKDEELHADYVRGLLIRTARPLPVLVVLGRQLVGAVAGWASVERHHRDRVRTAPGAARSLVATALIGAGRLSGQVSAPLARELRYQSFRRYLLLNAALERTAEIGYGRAVELAASAEEREALDRIRADEERHGEVFRLLAGVLDDHDRARPEVDPAALARDLAGVSPWFVPTELRPRAEPQRTRRGFGTGAPVQVERGSGDGDLVPTLRRCLDRAGLGELVAAHPGPVALRAAFMLGYHRDDRSNVVDPRVVEEIARYARDHGATDVAVLEAPTVYGRFFARRSVAEVARYLGYTSPLYRIVDLAADQVPWNFDRGLAQDTTSGTWHDAAVRIVVPKLRTDPAEIAHLALSSLHGMDGRVRESIHPDRQVSFRNAVMMLLDHSPPDAAIVDAWGPVADGPFGVMGCARPPTERRFYAGRDALAVDAAVLADLGVDDPRRTPSHRAACHWFGLDPAPPDVRGEPGPFGPRLRRPDGTRWSRLVSWLGSPVYTYASRHGELFVPAMDTAAFPPLRPPGPLVRVVRGATQRAFGLHPPPARRPAPPRAQVSSNEPWVPTS